MHSRRIVPTTIDQVAVGTDISITPNFGDKHKLLALRAEFVTSATAANRIPHLQLVDPNGNVFYETVAGTAQAATKTVFYSWVNDGGAVYQGSTLVDNVASMALPDFWVPAQFTWETVTTALDAGDQWSNITAMYEVGDEWEHLVLLESIEGAIGSLG